MYNESKLLMLGLRGSGKTTFLAALWHHVEADELGGRLMLPQLQPDRDYLNAVRNNWLSLKPVERTSMRSNNEVSLDLLDRKTNAHVSMTLPDLSGETFRLQWATRKAPRAYVEFARECTGAFLFVHPNEVAKTHVIKPESIDLESDAEDQHQIQVVPSVNWTPAQTSTQVQLVDVLQLLLRMRSIRQKMRLAVTVSAWDLVRGRIPPSVWLEKRLPMLSQFVRSNSDKLTSEVFGLSAQGGDLSADRDALLHGEVPSKRCYAVSGNSLDHVPFLAPLQFLIDDNELRTR